VRFVVADGAVTEEYKDLPLEFSPFGVPKENRIPCLCISHIGFKTIQNISSCPSTEKLHIGICSCATTGRKRQFPILGVVPSPLKKKAVLEDGH
jgi:hypothetical protein